MLQTERKLLISCDCGCSDGIEFRGYAPEDVDANTNSVYVSLFEGMFGSRQGGPIARLQDLTRHIRSNCFFDIIVTADDLRSIRAFLQEVACGEQPVRNELSLTVGADYDIGDNQPPIYTLSLDGRPKFKTLITGKTYRIYEYELNEPMRRSLIRAITSALCDKPGRETK